MGWLDRVAAQGKFCARLCISCITCISARHMAKLLNWAGSKGRMVMLAFVIVPPLTRHAVLSGKLLNSVRPPSR
jgi:hypothetical protein